MELAGLVHGKQPDMASPKVYCLTARGAREVLARFEMEVKLPKWGQVNHYLALNDVYVVLRRSVAVASFEIMPVVRAGVIRMIPDAAVLVYVTGRERRFYLEVDTGTMSLARVGKKLKEYEKLAAITKQIVFLLVITPRRKKIERMEVKGVSMLVLEGKDYSLIAIKEWLSASAEAAVAPLIMAR